MRTGRQAAAVAAATGGVLLPASLRMDGKPGAQLQVDVGADFEAHRGAVEAVSVLYQLFTDDGQPVATGWMLTAAKFEVAWPEQPQRAALVRSHFGARRFAFNQMLALVKAELDARTADPAYKPVRWTLRDLRKKWNTEKATAAPWWEENSKEAYASGIADLVAGLANWSASKHGQRDGRRVGFPKFSSARRDSGRVRFTTGAMRLEADRRTITLPVIGGLVSRENTRRVQRHVASGRARVMSMTLSQRWGRLFAAVNYALFTPVFQQQRALMPGVVAGVDLGVRQLAAISWRHPLTGREMMEEVANPAPLRAALNGRRRAARQMTRRVYGSGGWRAAKAKLARADRRAVHLRREAAHQLTTHLARRFGHIVIEDLDIGAMKRSMGRRAFRRSVSDAAMGQIRPMLVYKTARYHSVLTVADRWFASSQLHHGHTLPSGQRCRLTARRSKMDKMLVCPSTGVLVDRDTNAAANLRDWPGMPVQEQSVPGSRTAAVPATGREPAAQTPSTAGGLRSASKSTPPGAAMRSEAKTQTPAGERAK